MGQRDEQVPDGELGQCAVCQELRRLQGGLCVDCECDESREPEPEPEQPVLTRDQVREIQRRVDLARVKIANEVRSTIHLLEQSTGCRVNAIGIDLINVDTMDGPKPPEVNVRIHVNLYSGTYEQG